MMAAVHGGLTISYLQSKPIRAEAVASKRGGTIELSLTQVDAAPTAWVTLARPKLICHVAPGANLGSGRRRSLCNGGRTIGEHAPGKDEQNTDQHGNLCEASSKQIAIRGKRGFGSHLHATVADFKIDITPRLPGAPG
jgi:hypothetical protein